MVRFFTKKEEKTQLTDSEVNELLKNAYELGFEVGYHRHSELGWVSERYSMLEDLAKEAGISRTIKEKYTKGKEDGNKAKERDMHAGLAKQETEKLRKDSKVVYAVTSNNKENISGPGYKNSLVADEHLVSMIQQPSMVNLPSATSRTKAIEIPSQIHGLKNLHHKA